MNDCKVLLSLPLDFIPTNSEERKTLCKIFPPKVGEILADNNLSYIGLLTMSQEDIEDSILDPKKNKNKNLSEIKIPTPFEYLMALATEPKEAKVISAAIEFFIKEPVTIMGQIGAILIGDLEEELSKAGSLESLRMINSENFFQFQNLVRISVGSKPVEPPNPNEHPKIKAMKAKARLRDRIKSKSGKGINLSTTLAAICCMGIGITPLNIGEISYGSMRILTSMYQGKEKYELDIDSLLAGADSKKVKPKYWIKNLDD